MKKVITAMKASVKSIPGMQDLIPPQTTKWQGVEARARALFRCYNFEEIRTPLLEETQLFQRGIGEETGVVQKEMYTFLDRGGDSVTLRPEGTASVVRALIQHHFEQRDALVKLFYLGPMFRYERPQKGRLRQFHQIGCELLGSGAPQADVEVMALLDHLVRAVGVKDFRLEVNSLGRRALRQNYLQALVTYLQRYQSDMGAEDQRRLTNNPLRVLDSKDPGLAQIIAGAPVMLDSLSSEDRTHWDSVLLGLNDFKIPHVVNPRIVRGLDYYEQTAFELVSDQLGAQDAFAGGGRYNGLVQDLGGPEMPGVGFAIGVERLLLLVSDQAFQPKSTAFFICSVGDRARREAYRLVQQCRTHELVAETGFEERSIKSQLRRAHKLGFRLVGILGEDELIQGVIQLKDFVRGREERVPLAELTETLAKRLQDE